MKCPSCNAEIGTAKVCEFCGSQITPEMQKEQEQLNKKGCPKCGSSNISFKRENQGEIRGRNSKKVVHRTVGFCKDCGATWFADNTGTNKSNGRKTWLWVLGWLFIFPLPLTIILIRKKDMNNALKYGIIAVAWIVYLIIGLSGSAKNTDAKTIESPTSNSASEIITEKASEEDSQITTEEASAKEETTKETVTKKQASLGEMNSLDKAQQYLDYSGFSEKSLKEQLEYEGFNSEEIDYAIKNCGANWNEECAEKAQQYLDYSSFSKQGLKEQLEYEGFTSEQINYALKAVGY